MKERYYIAPNIFKDGGDAEKAMRYFMGKGMARHQAAGLVGNLVRESGLNPDVINKTSGAYGIAQWLGPRKKKLFAKYGNKPTLDQQLEFVWDELNDTHKSGLRHLMAAKTAEEAARMGMGYYEFQAGPEGAVAAMNKWGQDGEGSMRKGIENAVRLMGANGNNGIYGSYESHVVPDGLRGGFMPSNPEAFFAPLSTWSKPVVVEREPVQPVLVEAEKRAMKEAEDRQKMEGLNLLMGLMGGSNPYVEQLNGLMNVGKKVYGGIEGLMGMFDR